MHLNKRGVALLQVLIVAAILAGLSAMILRVVLSRTLVARQNRRTVSAQMLIERCMAEVNYNLAKQDPENYAKSLDGCCAHGWDVSGNKCITDELTHTTDIHRCQFSNPFNNGVGSYTVDAIFSKVDDQCQVAWQIENGVNTL